MKTSYFNSLSSSWSITIVTQHMTRGKSILTKMISKYCNNDIRGNCLELLDSRNILCDTSTSSAYRRQKVQTAKRSRHNSGKFESPTAKPPTETRGMRPLRTNSRKLHLGVWVLAPSGDQGFFRRGIAMQLRRLSAQHSKA